MRCCFRIALLAALLGLYALPLVAQSRPVPQINIEKLRAEIQAILDEDNIPGASVALVSAEGTIWAGGVGKADVAAGRDVTADSQFRVGSISKTFTALSVLTLVEQGRLDLNTPIRDLVPELEFDNPWEATDPVTLAMVMEHTTGFDDIHFAEYGKTDDPDMSLADGLAFHPDSRTSRWRPGTHMSYCNSGPPIAALVLEAVTGQDFESYAEEHIFRPLRMSGSNYHYPVEADLLSKGYEADGETEANYDHIIVRPSGALNASSADMSNYLQMMINRGYFEGRQLLRPETIERMERPATTLAARAGFDFGYGLGNYSSIVAGHHFHGHDGGITGFVSTSAYSPELGLGYFVSINKMSGKMNEIAKLVARTLTADHIATQPPPYALSEEEIGEITGYYQNVTPRSQFMAFVMRFMSIQKIEERDGKLFAKGLFGGEAKEVIPVSANSFRGEDQPVATTFRIAGPDGNMYLQGSMGGNNQQISALWAWFQPVAAIFSLIMMLSAIAFALIWIPAKAFGKMRSVPLGAVLPPFLASLSLVATVALAGLFLEDTIADLSKASTTSLTVFLGTIVFALLTLYVLFKLFRPKASSTGKLVRLHGVLVGLACALALFYLTTQGMIGMRFWAY